MMEVVRMVDVKLYSMFPSKDLELKVDVQKIHRSLNRDALDSCDFYQLSP